MLSQDRIAARDARIHTRLRELLRGPESGSGGTCGIARYWCPGHREHLITR